MGVLYNILVFDLVNVAQVLTTVVVAAILYKVAAHFIEKVLQD